MIQSAEKIKTYHYAIRHVARVAEQLERSGREVVYLNIGDPQVYGFRPPEHLVEAVARAMKDRFTGYSQSAGLPEAREAIARYATGLGAPTRPDEVLVTSGASEAADILLTALLDVHDEVLIPAPGYPIYPAILSKLGAVARYYPLDPANDWQLSADNIGSLITGRTKALVLINPNNPTGQIVSDESVKELLELAQRHDILVITDEVYRELCFDEAPTPASALAQVMGAPLVTLESLSKTHLVPGWRTGWMRFTHAEKMPDLIQAIHQLAGGRLCSPTPTQYAIRPALEGNREFQKDFIRELKTRRDVAVGQVNSTPGLSCAVPKAAFYLMIRAESIIGRSDERFVLDLLQETGVLVVHGSGFGLDPQAGCFRMVYLAGEATLEDVFSRLERFLATY
ncbi:MAG TPA: aminotransferase class I/II-fold pyridoxal phosphate-dependent enzyme [Pyrinomonadaceae bacterium]|nr:aminotransferase class I/II-fold pyridoxal phosphate-dependent enzyme [Pyrinomonadaceae bacterium]